MNDEIAWLESVGRAPAGSFDFDGVGRGTQAPPPVGTPAPPTLEALLRRGDRDMLWCMILCPDDDAQEDGAGVPDGTPPDKDDDREDDDDGEDGSGAGRTRR